MNADEEIKKMLENPELKKLRDEIENELKDYKYIEVPEKYLWLTNLKEPKFSKDFTLEEILKHQPKQ